MKITRKHETIIQYSIMATVGGISGYFVRYIYANRDKLQKNDRFERGARKWVGNKH